MEIGSGKVEEEWNRLEIRIKETLRELEEEGGSRG